MKAAAAVGLAGRGSVLFFLHNLRQFGRRQVNHLGGGILCRRIGLRCVFSFRLGLRILTWLPVWLAICRLGGMLCLALFGGIDSRLVKAEIMIRKLGIRLSCDPLACGGGVMRQCQIFLVQLLCISAQLYIRTV